MRLIRLCVRTFLFMLLMYAAPFTFDICFGADSAVVGSLTDQMSFASIAIQCTATDRGAGLSAVEKLTDQELLKKVALNAQDLYIRKAAVEKLTDESVLGKIAIDDNNANVRLSAVMKLTDQLVLAKVARADADVYVRKAAVEKMTDQTILSKIATDDKNSLVRYAAVERITSKTLLSKFALGDKDSNIRLSAIKRLTDQTLFAKLGSNDKDTAIRQAAVEKLTDQKVLTKIALHDEESAVRKAAVMKLSNQAILAKIAKADDDEDIRKIAKDKLTDQTILSNIALNDKDLEMRKTAIERLTNQAVLKKLALNDKDLEIRKSATSRLTDQTLLMEIASKNPAAAMRLAAVTNSNLNDDSFILRRSVEDISAEVRLAAVHSLRTQKALAEVAQTSYEAGLREAANRRLNDSALRSETATTQQQIKAEVASIEKLSFNDDKLVEIALNAKYDLIGEAAARRLDVPALLGKIAVESHRRNIVKIVFAKLEEKSVLETVAKKSADPSVRLAAQIKMGKTWQEAFAKASAPKAPKQALGEVLAAITLFPKQDGVQEGVVEACLNFIRRGDESRIPELGELLHSYGDIKLTEDYLNCGQPDLDREARLWASQHGYHITTGAGSNRATWGAGRY
jgi:hypothetical protein